MSEELKACPFCGGTNLDCRTKGWAWAVGGKLVKADHKCFYCGSCNTKDEIHTMIENYPKLKIGDL